jgi:integrase
VPHSIFFHEGYAIHGTQYVSRLGRQASHGCVRLHPANAATLFALVREHGRDNTSIEVTGTARVMMATAKPRPVRKNMFIPIMLAACCGLRRGEIAALRWSRLDGAQLSISESVEQTRAGIRYKPPKSGRARTVALSGFVVDELRRHRIAQAQELLRVGIRQTDDMFIVAQADGKPLQPRSLTHAWEQFIQGTALPRIRFHDLRHAHATHLLASGVHPKVASERLGHSKVGITLDLYSHVLPGMQADAAAKVDDALQAALRTRNRLIGS